MINNLLNNPEIISLLVLVNTIVIILLFAYLIKLASPVLSSMVKAKASASQGSSSGTIHPGMSDEHFMAIVGAATSHYQADNQRLVAILTAAAAHTLGVPVSVVKFKPLNTMDWTWAIQGRVSNQSHKA